MHPFKPIINPDSRILILGSTPSPQSRKGGFYYGHPQNRFWKLLAALTSSPIPQTMDEKTAFLAAHYIALYDVIDSCDIQGAADASIQNPVPNDIQCLIAQAPIEAIFLNGTAAYTLYMRFFSGRINLPALRLPSTSPANAAWSLDRLESAWGVIQKFIQ